MDSVHKPIAILLDRSNRRVAQGAQGGLQEEQRDGTIPPVRTSKRGETVCHGLV